MAELNTKWILNLVDKVSAPLKTMQKSMAGVTKASQGLSQSFNAIALRAVAFQQISQTFNQLGADIDQAVAPGVALQSSMKDLQAITGATSDQMAIMQASARGLAKAFGSDASKGVEVYKLLLSQLGPDLAKTPKIMDEMAKNAIMLSKTMGGDTTAAVEVLTTAMNQFGVSIKDPVHAQKELARMMNVMSAGAKEGSAELPALKAAIQNVGGDAKRANLSFEQMVAAIEALDKAGKKGAEGGVALRNVLTTLSQGRFLPKAVQQELLQAGVNVTKLSDKSVSFTDKLRELKKISGDAAVITKMFGKENQLAAAALVGSADSIDTMTKAITGTNTATEQSQIIMGSFSERMARMNAWFKDLGISLFNATEGFLPFLQGGIQGMGVLARLAGTIEGVKLLLGGFWKSITLVGKGLQFAGKSAFRFSRWVGLTGIKVLQASGRFLIAALQGIGSFTASIITATAAQLGLNVALTANPIGLIVVGVGAAVAAIAGMIKYWDQIKAVIAKFTQWIVKNNPFSWMINIVDKVFPGFKQSFIGFFKGLYDWMMGWAKKIWEALKSTWDSIAGLFGFGSDNEATVKVVHDTKGLKDTDSALGAKLAPLSQANLLGTGVQSSPTNHPKQSHHSNPTNHPNHPTGFASGSSGKAGNAASGKSITMNLEINNNFNLGDSDNSLESRIEQIKEQITQMIVDSGRDALVALG